MHCPKPQNYGNKREEVESFARTYTGYKLSSSICAVIFIALVLSDVWKAYRRKATWIPGRALVLSAIPIQLLLFIDHLDVSVNSSNQYLKSTQLILLVEEQLLIDSRRVMMCVFIAYLLPGIVSRGLRSVWGDVGALAFIVIAHMAYEAYFLVREVYKVSRYYWYTCSFYEEYWNLYDPGPVGWLIPSYIAVSLAMILLVMLLSCAVIAGKSIRNTMSQKVPSTLSSCCDSGENRLCNNIKDHVLRSWIVVRASQPDYIMARSVFGAFAGVVVTLCDALLIVKWVFVPPPPYPVVLTAFGAQLAFVVVGSIVVVFRWVSAVFYFRKDLGYLLRCEEFWTREIVQRKRELRRCRLILSLLLTMLQYAQKLVVFLSKVCWFISQFPFRKIRPSTMKDDQFSKYKEALETIRMPGETAYSLWRANKSAFDNTNNNFEKGIKNGKSSFKKLISLVHQTREIPDGEAPTSLKEEKLFKAVVKNSRTDLKEEKHFKTVGKISWKMRAVSLIHLIIYLCDGTDSDEVNDCIEAYRQAFPFMEMVDRSDPEAKLASEAADNEFTTRENIWQKHPKMRSAENFMRAQRDEEKALNRPQSQREEAIGTEDQGKASNELLKQKIRTPLEDNIKKLYQEEESKGEKCDKYPSVDEDTEDLKTVAARISLYKIWNVVVLDSNQDDAIQTSRSNPDDAIQTSRSNPDDAFQKLRSNPGDAINKLRCLLAHIIYHCIEGNVLDEAIRKNCNKWAEDGEENEIFNAASIAGKAQGVREQINQSRGYAAVRVPV